MLHDGALQSSSVRELGLLPDTRVSVALAAATLADDAAALATASAEVYLWTGYGRKRYEW